MPAPAAPLLVPSTGDAPPTSPRNEREETAADDHDRDRHESNSPDPELEPQPTLKWSAHPARERPAIAAAALMVIVLLSLATGMTAGSMSWSLLAAFLLLAAVRRFFLTSDHVVDDEGVSARHLLGSRFLPWRRIRRVVVDERGGFVGTSAQRSWLDPIRGIHLTFPASIDIAERERIAATIRGRAGLPMHGSTTSSTSGATTSESND